MEEFKPAPVLMVNDLETLKILADPLRNQILEILAPEKLTVNQIAEKLGLASSKLYYHINLMEKQGLIREVDSITKGNIIEKIYWISAYECKMADNLCNFSTSEGQESIMTSMVAPIDTTREDIIRSLEARATALEQGAKAHPRNIRIYREVRNISDELADQFNIKLQALLDDFDNIESEETGEDVHRRALTVAYYPSFYYPPGEGSEE